MNQTNSGGQIHCDSMLYANLLQVQSAVQEDTVHTTKYWLKFDSLNAAVTLIIGSRSPNVIKCSLFIMLLSCTHTNFVEMYSANKQVLA